MSEMIMIFGILIVGYFLMSDPSLLSSLGGSSKKSTPVVGSTTATGSCIKTIYPTTTGKWTPTFNGGTKVGYASGGASTTYRWDADGVTSDSLEATYYVTWPSGSGKGDHLELKFWGPSHSGSSCCWCMFNINGKGETGIGHEGPHPSTKNFSVKGKNIGSIVGKKVGIKGVIWPSSEGAHIEGWVDTTGKWVKVVEYDGPCGVGKKSTKPVVSQQIQFRVDTIKPTMHCSSIVAIKKPTTVKSNFAYEYTGQMQYVQRPRYSRLVSPALMRGYI